LVLVYTAAGTASTAGVSLPHYPTVQDHWNTTSACSNPRKAFGSLNLSQNQGLRVAVEGLQGRVL